MTTKKKRISTVTSAEMARESVLDSSDANPLLENREGTHAYVDGNLQRGARVDSSLDRIQIMDASQLTLLQSALEHGNEAGFWQTPAKWGGGGRDCMRNIDLYERIVANLEQRHQGVVRSAGESIAHSLHHVDVEGAHFRPPPAARIQAIIDGAVLTMTRYLLLCRMGPAGFRKASGRSLDTTTITQLGYTYLPAMLSVAVGKQLDNDAVHSHRTTISPQAMTSYFSLVQPEDLDRFTEHVRARLKLETNRLRMFADKGLWSDVPIWVTAIEPVTAVKGVAIARREQPKPVDKHLPLPDDYVAEMGRKSLWIMRDLGPNLYTIASGVNDIWQRTAALALTETRIGKLRISMVAKYLEDYAWLDSEGAKFDAPPFELRLRRIGRRRTDLADIVDPESATGLVSGDEREAAGCTTSGECSDQPLDILQWPPRTFVHIQDLLGVLQSAHLFVVAMSLAPRKMELLSLNRNCVVRARDGSLFASGRTFKLVERHEGQARDWSIPEVATVAIEQQVRLVSLIELIGPQLPLRPANIWSDPPSEPGSHLWVQTGHGRSKRTQPLENVSHALMAYARALGMSDRPAGQTIRTHRFRKTVARLAALALTDAPMILMQVFGHKSVEMTLYYILTDCNLQAEVENVRRELKIMRGVAVVEDMVAVAMTEAAQEAQEAIPKAKGDLGACAPTLSLPTLLNAGYGGRAAPKLFGAVKEQVIAVHRTGREWGASDSYETAYFLTEAGLTFTMPRNGVFCTKAFTQPAACTGRRGKTDPGNCQSDCGHRLELAARRAQLEASLIKQVALYEEALGEGHELLRRGLAKKICDALKPFDDIREKWMKHATVRELVESTGVAA